MALILYAFWLPMAMLFIMRLYWLDCIPLVLQAPPWYKFCILLLSTTLHHIDQRTSKTVLIARFIGRLQSRPKYNHSGKLTSSFLTILACFSILRLCQALSPFISLRSVLGFLWVKYIFSFESLGFSSSIPLFCLPILPNAKGTES